LFKQGCIGLRTGRLAGSGWLPVVVEEHDEEVFAFFASNSLIQKCHDKHIISNGIAGKASANNNEMNIFTID